MAKEKLKSAENWIAALELSKKDTKSWETKGDKIVKRYRDERGESNTSKRYNILWSNIQTLFPAVYSRKPKAQCDRRYKDKDPVGRTAAQILERALQYEIDHYSDYDSAIRNALRDRLLPGRGVAWVRYEQAGQITDDVEKSVATDYDEEYSPCDYVFWKDFRMSPARTWEEVTWVARRVYMEKEAGVKRFGDDFKNVPLSHEPVGLDDMDIGQKDQLKKAIVWEIYNKQDKKVIWVAENYQYILDERADPLELDCFFPCPKPLFATLTTDSLIPVADYLQYQDQAMELDEITARIGKLVDACKVVGIYDASQPAIERMLSEGYDNSLVPVDSWAMLAEKGGLKGSVDWFPLDQVVGALAQMYAAREQTVQVIYAVTGLSDIVRGASQASETATAQQIKSNFASLRLKEIQNSVAVFASELLNIKAQIMCSFYKPETLIEMSGIMGTDDAQFAEPAIELLKNGKLRDFRIEVASDSLVELDERGEQESRTQFLAAVGGFLQQAVQAPPELAPLMGEMLLFGVRGFKVGRDIENAFDEAMAKLREPKPPQADPNEAIQQAEQMKLQAQQQSEQQRMQVDMQIEQNKAQLTGQLEAMKAEQAQAIEAAKIEFERWKAELEASTKVTVAEIQAKTSLKQASISANSMKESEGLTEIGEEGEEQPTSALSSLVEAINMNMANLMGLQQQSHADIIAQVTKPKRRIVERGADGKAIGMIEVND
jgi:hypothetical protein